MNTAVISGNLCGEPETTTTQNGISRCNFRLAVQRRVIDKATGKRECDFIPVVAWRQQADFLTKYAHKGDKVTVRGSVSVRIYEQDGARRYVTEINADEVELTNQKRAAASAEPATMETDSDEELPF